MELTCNQGWCFRDKLKKLYISQNAETGVWMIITKYLNRDTLQTTTVRSNISHHSLCCLVMMLFHTNGQEAVDPEQWEETNG